MRNLTVLALLIAAMIGCKKKEDPKPEPPKPITEARTSFVLESKSHDISVDIDWENGPGTDTTIYRPTTSVVMFLKTVKQKDISVKIYKLMHNAADTNRIYFKVKSPTKLYENRDTSFNRTYELW